MARIAIRNRLKAPIQLVTETGVRSPRDTYAEIAANQTLEIDVDDEGEIGFAALPYAGATRNRIDVMLQWFTEQEKMRHRISSRSMRVYTQIYRHAQPVMFELKTRTPVLRLLRFAVPAALIIALVSASILFAQSGSQHGSAILPTPVPTGETTILAPTSTATVMATATLAPTATAAPQPTVRPPTHVPPAPPTRTPVPPTATPVPPTSTPTPQPLIVTITQPANNAPVSFYTTTTFTGNASDPNNGANLLGNDLEWVVTQGVNTNVMGFGPSVSYTFDGSAWSVGNATVTLYATDPANGLSNHTQITISLYYAE